MITSTRARDLFLRLLALTLIAAFLSLYVQLDVLFGSAGLAPICPSLRSSPQLGEWLQQPTLFWMACDDHVLTLAAWVGVGVSVCLFVGLLPIFSLLAAWLIYLSFVSVGSPFLDFQWDNLLLETSLLSLFIAPWRRGGGAILPARYGALLMLWLSFRLHFESGVAKLISGDPTWRDLTAMVSYYETAPLPTWIGWYVHQLPVWSHRISAALTLLIELVVPFFFFGPLRLRRIAAAAVVGFQLFVLLTANYTIFNYLSASLAIFLLIGASEAVTRRRQIVSGIVIVPLALLSVLPFAAYVGAAPAAAFPVMRALAPWRSFNVYHLFASMTLVRREAVIEGSHDGAQWLEYDFWHKPGDPMRRPEFVAPHQPRVDFQLWFLLLGKRGAPYFDRLLYLILHQPAAVRSLFRVDPFPTAPPRYVRVAIYRYRFTDREMGAATGLWWERTLEGYTKPLHRSP